MKKLIVAGSMLAGLASPTLSFADGVQYSGHQCVVNPLSNQSVGYRSDSIEVSGSGSKVFRCPGWTQTHASAAITMPKMSSFGSYVKAKNISSARMCVTRKHFAGVPGNSLSSFSCGAVDTTTNSTFSWDLKPPTGTGFSRFDQPSAVLIAESNQRPRVRFYGFRYQ